LSVQAAGAIGKGLSPADSWRLAAGASSEGERSSLIYRALSVVAALVHPRRDAARQWIILRKRSVRSGGSSTESYEGANREELARSYGYELNPASRPSCSEGRKIVRIKNSDFDRFAR